MTAAARIVFVVVKYIGSKRVLVPAIERMARALPVASACDVFAGTTRVGQGLRRAGLRVHSNDLATYSEVLGQAYIAADETVDRERLRGLLKHLSGLPGEHGYFTETFCVQSRFFQPENGRRVDAIRNEIDRLGLSEVERASCSPASWRLPTALTPRVDSRWPT